MSDTRKEAARLLRRYDKLRAELRAIEPLLNKTCASYGREIGIYGYTRDHLHMHLQQKKEAKA